MTGGGGDGREIEPMVVHNLKAPLTGLLATLEMLADGDFGPLEPTQREAVAAMWHQGEELLALIERLLEISRLEAPGIRVQRSRQDMNVLLRGLDAEWSARFGGRLSVSVESDLPDAMADGSVMRRVLENLLLNARMHGGEHVSVRIAASADDSVVRIDVEDDGPGVPDADADRIFEKFVRSDPPLGAVPRRGSGLGLAYCRAAMAAHGGRIGLRRGTASGASFRVELPVAPSGAGVAEPAP